jgi:hypothetical protein
MLTDFNDNDGDWETVDIPNLIVPNEKEKKILAERKLVEEADALLTEELFLDKKENKEEGKKENKEEGKKENKENKKEGKKDFDLLEKRKKEHVDRQKQEAQRVKKQKEERIRIKEVYGEAKIDEYDEQYGAIKDRY